MNVLNQYVVLTEKAIKLVQAEEWNDNREDFIARMDQLLGDREELQAVIKPPFTSEEEVLGRVCVALNKQLDQLLDDRKQEIKQDIQRVQTQKQHNTKYANPYESMEIDGYYYDKRK